MLELLWWWIIPGSLRTFFNPCGSVRISGPAITAGMDPTSAVAIHLRDSAQHLKLLTMGVILLTVLRFSPRGLLPER